MANGFGTPIALVNLSQNPPRLNNKKEMFYHRFLSKNLLFHPSLNWDRVVGMQRITQMYGKPANQQTKMPRPQLTSSLVATPVPHIRIREACRIYLELIRKFSRWATCTNLLITDASSKHFFDNKLFTFIQSSVARVQNNSSQQQCTTTVNNNS